MYAPVDLDISWYCYFSLGETMDAQEGSLVLFLFQTNFFIISFSPTESVINLFSTYVIKIMLWEISCVPVTLITISKRFT